MTFNTIVELKGIFNVEYKIEQIVQEIAWTGIFKPIRIFLNRKKSESVEIKKTKKFK